MSRRIETGTATPKLGENAKPEEYLGRLVKYIPAEIVAIYLAATGFVPAVDESRQTWLWIIFAACAVLTPIYFYLATRDKEKGNRPLVIQVVLATVAFPVWVFAVGGPFAALAWYKSYVASIILIFVTSIFGKIKPPVGA
jgi:ACR3 family arsenite efflux pump ArsB